MTHALHYEIALDPPAHEFAVTLSVSAPVDGGLTLSLPAWIPGSYMVRDFARNITEIGASDGDGPVEFVKKDKQTWVLGRNDGRVAIRYRVYALELSVRSAYLDRKRGYFNGTSLFLRPSGFEDAPWSVRIVAPEGEAYARWRVFTTMPAGGLDARGYGVYRGRGYAALVDYPVEIGEGLATSFELDGKRHTLVVSDGGRFDIERIGRDLSPICNEHAAMFGELPIDQYLFMVLATGDGYGGLEHRDSTSLVCRRADLPARSLDKPDKAYRQFLGLCSHEYFHLWNVKRIRPERLARADLSAEVHTELLWAFEGITSYYDDLALVRSGTIALEDYLELLAGIVSRVQRGPGRHRQSVAASSFDAWTKFYKQDENAPNAIVSYYAKGAMVAFGMDLALRIESDGRLCLDDLMRLLWQRFGKPDIGLPERGIERLVAQLLGEPLDDFFASYVYGTAELPLADWFAEFGIGFRLRPAQSADDLGGCRPEPPKDPPPPGLGLRFEVRPEGLQLTQVLSGSPAQDAGLAPGDLLLAIDGERVSQANLIDLLRRAGDDAVQVHYFRRDRLCVTGLRPYAVLPDDTCDLWPLDESALSADQLARRAAWLRSSQAS